MRCDTDDLMCQLQVMNHLEGMRKALGNEKFASRFPELEGIGPMLDERMKEQETIIREAYERCGIPEPVEEEREE